MKTSTIKNRGYRNLPGFLFLLSLLLVPFSRTGAQPFDIYAEPPGMDTIELPPGYRFDNTFRFGAIVSGADSLTVAWMKDIGLDYTYTYGGPSTNQWAELRDSSGWPSNELDRFPKRFDANRWRYQGELGVGAIYAPGYTSHVVPDAQALEMFYENYYYHPTLRSFYDTASRRGCDMLGKSPDKLLHQRTGYAGAGRFDPCDTCSEDRAIARNGVWTNEVLQVRPWSTGPRYEALGYTDSSEFFDLSFAIRVNTASNEFIVADSSSVLAYAITWRRDTIGQTLGKGPDRQACHCAFFVPVDTFYITKDVYLDSLGANVFIRRDKNPNEQDYREYFFPFRFPNDTLMRSTTSDTLALIPLDTTITINGLNYSSIPVYGDCIATDSNGDCIEWGTRPYKPSDRDFGGGARFGEDTTWRGRYCDRLLDTLIARGVYPNVDSLAGRTIPFKNDFVWEFRTTNLVQIDFLMGRISNHFFRLLQRGDLDSLIVAEVQGALDDTAMGDLMVKIALSDEPNDVRYPGSALVASKVQRAILDRDSTDTRGTFVNPKSLAWRYRIHTGDIDSTEVKINQLSINQTYPISPQLPITYANPELMSWQASREYYNMDLKDTLIRGKVRPRRFIMGPSPKDYGIYTEYSQGFAQNVIDRHRLDADVSRKWFRHHGAIPYPVGGIVQVHAWLADDPYCDPRTGDCKGWLWGRPITPEEITTQAWLALNFGLDGGLMFSDFTFCGPEFGVVNGLSFDDSTEYGRLSRHPDPRWRRPGDTLPQMWLGFASRSDAVERVISEFTQKILPVYAKLDLYGVETFSIDNKPDSVAMPLLDMVKTEKAGQYTDSANLPTGVYDPPDSTFLEVSIFRPTPEDTIGYRKNALYVLTTNKRMYPKDFNLYADSTLALLDSLATDDTAAADDYQNRGYGRIDFRRPVVVLKNSSDLLADSAVIEKVGYESEWTDTIAFGNTVCLDWLDPGWGAMYRVIPLPASVSEHGVAYNNAVRSENPSTESKTRDRLVVYERDSVVYMRAVDSTGAWSAEVMVSDPNDTVLVDGERTASNYFPALAVSRAGKGHLRVIWERDSSDYRSVMSRLFLSDSITRDSIRDPELIDYGYTLLQRLDSAELWEASWNMTPAIVAASDDHGEAGFVVSWADQSKGVNVLVVREQTDLRYYRRDGLSSVAFYDTASVRQVRNIDTSDRVCQYPTLANVPRQAIVNFRASDCFGVSGTIPGVVKEKELPETLADIEDPREVTLLHLSYQQGDGVDGLGEEIYYHRLGVTIPSNAKRQPGLWVGKDEHVTKNLRACSFEHPSIAADSVRIGVSFEVVTSDIRGLPTVRHIGLRFRDTTGMDRLTGIPLKAWETYLYRWVGSLGRPWDWPGRYERPSLTHFPSTDSLRLVSQPEGGLTWFRRDGPDGRSYPQFLYRYGWFGSREIGDGKDPTLTLVPLIKVDPFERTSIFHRSDDSSRVAGLNDEGDEVWRYPARLLNSPGNPMSALFSGSPPTGGIIANAEVGRYTGCYLIEVDWRVRLIFARGSVKHPDDDRHGPGDPKILSGRPGLPPSYFLGPGDGRTVVSDLSESEEVVRTSLFIVEDGPVRLRRIVAAGEDVIDYLNGFGWDTERKAPADIWTVMELVRFSDSVVLWRSDTLSARGLDSLSDSVDEFLEIPAHTVADSGEIVWARMRSFATEGVAYKMTSGFTHYRFDSTSVGLQKRSTPWRIERGEDQSSSEGGLGVEVLPNPLRDRGEVRVRVRESGEVRVSLWNLFGEQLAELPMIDSEGAGEYSVEVDMSAAKSGTYLLRVESIDEFATAMFTVLR